MLTNSPSAMSMSTRSMARSRSPVAWSTYSIRTSRAWSARPAAIVTSARATWRAPLLDSAPRRAGCASTPMIPEIVKSRTPNSARSPWRSSVARRMMDADALRLACTARRSRRRSARAHAQPQAGDDERHRRGDDDRPEQAATRDARKLRATSRNRRSTVRTPCIVGITIEKNAPRKTTAIFDAGPKTPNMITSTGSSAMRGRELKKFSHGSRAYCRRRNRPAAGPAGCRR